jgi:gas vesicle protein
MFVQPSTRQLNATSTFQPELNFNNSPFTSSSLQPHTFTPSRSDSGMTWNAQLMATQATSGTPPTVHDTAVAAPQPAASWTSPWTSSNTLALDSAQTSTSLNPSSLTSPREPIGFNNSPFSGDLPMTPNGTWETINGAVAGEQAAGLRDWLKKDLPGPIDDRVREKAGDIRDTARRKKDEAKAWVNDKKEDTKELARDVRDTARRKKDEAKAWVNDKKEDTKELARDVRDTARRKKDEAKAWVNDKKEDVEETAGRVGGAISDGWNDTTTSLNNFQDMMERNKDAAWLKNTHTVLNGIGLASNFIPMPVLGQVVGVAADGINAGLYALEGQETQAAMAAASMVPGLGELRAATGAAKAGANLLKNSRFVQDQDKLIRGFTQVGRNIDDELTNIKPTWDAATGTVDFFDNAFKGDEVNQTISGGKALVGHNNLIKTISAFA